MICKVCGSEFKKKHKNHSYCCRKCQKSDRDRSKEIALRRAKRSIVRCSSCGSEFRQKNKNHRLCSHECRLSTKRSYKKEVLVCAFSGCDNVFVKLSHNHQFCCNKHRKIDRRDRLREIDKKSKIRKILDKLASKDWH